jgi:hypothetical protein
MAAEENLRWLGMSFSEAGAAIDVGEQKRDGACRQRRRGVHGFDLHRHVGWGTGDSLALGGSVRRGRCRAGCRCRPGWHPGTTPYAGDPCDSGVPYIVAGERGWTLRRLHLPGPRSRQASCRAAIKLPRSLLAAVMAAGRSFSRYALRSRS